MVNAQSRLGDCRPNVLGNNRGCSLTLDAECLHQLPMSAPAHLADPLASSLGKGLPQALDLGPHLRLVPAQQGAGYRAVCRSLRLPLIR